MRIDHLLAKATAQLSSSDTARLDAELLLAHVLDKPRSYFFTWPEKEVSAPYDHQFEHLIHQRQQGIPIAYLIGEKEFWSLRLKVNEATLIPRPDTEHLVELALACPLPEPHKANVADLGTGTGAIALALAHEQPNWQVYAIEKSQQALAVAKENAQLNHINNVSFLEGSWCEPLRREAAALDMIVSNPPYIPAKDQHLQQGDVRFEPLSALASGADGLGDIRLIIKQSAPLLKPGGWLLLEHGYDQGVLVRTLFTRMGFCQIRTESDLSDHERVSLGRKPGRLTGNSPPTTVAEN